MSMVAAAISVLSSSVTIFVPRDQKCFFRRNGSQIFYTVFVAVVTAFVVVVYPQQQIFLSFACASPDYPFSPLGK